MEAIRDVALKATNSSISIRKWYYTALAALNERGFKPDRATGMLVVARDGAGVEACEGVRRLFRDILPDAATVALAAPAGEGWRERTRVSLFAVGSFGGVGSDPAR